MQKSADKAEILLIDDEEDILYLVGRMLEKEGFEVERVQTGAEGIKKAKEHKPDLILLDIMLPDISGWELSKELKEDKETKGIPIVMLTIRTSEPSVEKSFVYSHCEAHIGKPFKREKLINTINWVLKHRMRKKGEK